MSVIAGFSVPAESFALDRTLREHPEVTVEVERLATHSREWVMPFLWAAGPNLDAFEDSLEADPTVEDVHRTEPGDEVRLYNVYWSDDVTNTVDEILDQHGIFVEVEGRGNQWYLTLRFREHEQLERFQAYFRNDGVRFELRRLETAPKPKQRQFDLTKKQRESLVVAHQMGHFEVPQRASVSEVADRLGVSQGAASNRIHRGVDTLVRNTLTVALSEGSERAESGSADERE